MQSKALLSRRTIRADCEWKALAFARRVLGMVLRVVQAAATVLFAPFAAFTARSPPPVAQRTGDPSVQALELPRLPAKGAQEILAARLPFDRHHSAELNIPVSVVVPLCDEEAVLPTLTEKLLESFASFNAEILFCENGSHDRTRKIARALALKHTCVRLVTMESASYGAAIRRGIEEAQTDFVVIFNADWWCSSFFFNAVVLLQSGYDIVIGSKRLIAANDHRPFLRRAITHSFNFFLTIAFGFEGTDTHGMKALRRSAIIDNVRKCRTSKEVFDTELVLRCQRAGAKIREIPVEVFETRSRPAPLIRLMRRIPSTLHDLTTIARTL